MFPLFVSVGGLGFLRAILNSSSDIQDGQAELQDNKRVRSICDAPDNPQHVAEDKQPESPIPLELPLRSYHPRRDHCN